MADFDSDGDPDLVMGNGVPTTQGPANELFLNDGTGRLVSSAGALPGDTDVSHGVAVFDIEPDGDPDLVFANSGSRIRVFINDGAAVFHDGTDTWLPDDVEPSVDVIVTGEGDIAFASVDWQNRLLLRTPSGVYASGVLTTLPTEWTVAWGTAVGDIDGDGDVDVLFGEYGGGVLVYVNRGDGTFVEEPNRLQQAFSNTTGAVLADFDGDGDLDAWLANYARQQDQLYINDGAGWFTDETAARILAQLRSALSTAVADFDGDGDLERPGFRGVRRPHARGDPIRTASRSLERQRRLGRAASRRDQRRVRRQLEMAQDAVEDRGVGEQVEDLPRSAAVRAHQDVHLEDPMHELGPRVPPSPTRRWWRTVVVAVGVSAMRAGGLLVFRWVRDDEIAVGRGRREHPVVGDEVHARPRHQGGEPGDEVERVEDDVGRAVTVAFLRFFSL